MKKLFKKKKKGGRRAFKPFQHHLAPPSRHSEAQGILQKNQIQSDQLYCT